MAIRWTQEVEGGPRRVNHAAVSIRNRFIFSFGGYCTGEEYNQIVNIDVHVFDTGKFVEIEVEFIWMRLGVCAQIVYVIRKSAWQLSEISWTCMYMYIPKVEHNMVAYRKCFVSTSLRRRYLTSFVLSFKVKASAYFANEIFAQNSQTSTVLKLLSWHNIETCARYKNMYVFTADSNFQYLWWINHVATSLWADCYYFCAKNSIAWLTGGNTI